LLRYALIGAVLLVLTAAFALTAGWFTPRLTQQRMMAAFQTANGAHPGFRRNHAKGLCLSGWFDGNPQAASLSKAAIFEMQHVPIMGRFALAGGMPFQADTPEAVRSLALRLMPSSGEEWRMGMNDIPVFAVNSAQGFYDQLIAATPDPATGKPRADAMQDFFSRHPESVAAIALIKARAISSGFADSTYNSLNAFRLVNAAGDRVAVRWAAVPVQPFVAADLALHQDKNYLFDAVISQLREHPLKWRLVFIVASPGDATTDATVPWPNDRRQIDAGIITIAAASSEDQGACNYVNYDPLVLPFGIEPSDDPLLSARSSAYARSFTLRAAEKMQRTPGAVSIEEVQAKP
jgi:catalase